MTPQLSTLTQFASAKSAESGIIEGLGIDWTLLVLQAIAFLILVLLLGKFVYPVFFRIIDERQAKIDESLKAATDAEKHASEAQARIDEQLEEARVQARDIVATAKSEADAMLEKADEKSKSNAEHLITTARSEIEKETISAKKALQAETLDLVARATSLVVADSLDGKSDQRVIEKAVKGARG